MNRAATITRSILIYSLILSLGSIGFCARPVMAAPQHVCAKSADPLKAQTCCCPGCNGRCNGTCCQQQRSKPTPPSQPSRPDNDKDNLVVLAVQVGSIAVGNSGGAAAYRSTTSLDGSQAILSLQSQHVRIQT
jgi:hypothetical protein